MEDMTSIPQFVLPVFGLNLVFNVETIIMTWIVMAALIVFAVLAGMGKLPWEYVVYGILAEILLVWSLRPNIKRLMNGTERLIGLRAKRSRTSEAGENQ